MHCLAGRTRVSVQVLQVTCAQGFATRNCVKRIKRVEATDLRNIRTLFESCFLHDGHIGSGVSFFTFDSPSTAVDSSDRPEDEYKVNLTGIRVLRL